MATDAFAYLENSNDGRARAWIRTQNDRTSAELEGDSRFQRYYQAVLAGETSDGGADDAGSMAKPGWMSMQQGWVYQVRPDTRHPRGVWRRATLESFLAKTPEWHALLDVDALSAAECRDWTFGSAYVSPDGRRCLIQLLLGGSITAEWREFDLERGDFVPDGFRLPASTASQGQWRNDHTLLVTADFGPGTVSALGNALVVKEWQRGESLAAAKEIFRGTSADIGVAINPLDSRFGSVQDEDGNLVAHIWHIDEAERSTWWRLGPHSILQRLTSPPDTVPVLYRSQYLMVLMSDWEIDGRTWKRGEVISIPASEATTAIPRIDSVLRPARDESVAFVGSLSSGGVLLFGSSVGNSRLWRARPGNEAWTVDVVPLPQHGSMLQGASAIDLNVTFVRYESFLHPPALYRVDVAENAVTLFASTRAEFDDAAFVAEQLEAKSADGTLVPYFIVRPKALRFDGRAPVLALGYGARGGSQSPTYSGALGKLWLEQGGVYVVANVRGGRERGPEWHVTGVARERTYEDMIAVAEDLIRREITSARRIGFLGYSSGGLLGGVMLTQRPDLFGAAILKAPVLDQLRRDLLMRVLVWDSDFGSLDDPEVCGFLERTSPFQNLRAGASLPRPLLVTSAADQIVFPAQARRFAAKMASLGMPFLFYETNEEDPGPAAVAIGRARLEALIYTYLARELLDGCVDSR